MIARAGADNVVERILRQGRLDFSVAFKVQTRWGRMEAVAWTLECAGAMLFTASALAGELLAGMAAGVALVAAAIVLLLMHLGQPLNAWRAFANLRQSWLSRGTLALAGFVLLGGLYVLLRLAGVPPEATAVAALRWLLIADAAFILAYPGLVLSASPAIPFWNSGLMPLISLANGAASGAALFLLLVPSGARTGAVSAGAVFLAWALIALGTFVWLQVVVTLSRGAAAAESAACLTRAHGFLFWFGACLAGIAIPLALALWLVTGGNPALIPFLAAARLPGDYALRAALLRSGLFEKPV